MTVPSQRPLHSFNKIAFVGEAPGDQEVREGHPFVGPAGKIFNQLLRTAGIDREESYVGNAFGDKLSENNISNWTIPLREAKGIEGGLRFPPVGGAFLHPRHHLHLDNLKAELECLKPHVIVPLGGTALWALTGQSGITAARGQVMAATQLVPGAKLLPTFHPMAVQHQWHLYTVVVGDLIKAVAEAQRGPQIVLPKRELILEPDIEDIRRYRDRIRHSSLLSVDIETGWGQITCIGFAADSESALVVPFLDLRKTNRSYWSTPELECGAWELVREILDTPVPKLGQNYGAYDAFWLLQKKHIFTRNLLHDTRLLHHALYPELPKSLAFMGASYGSQGEWKSMGRAARHTKRDDA